MNEQESVANRLRMAYLSRTDDGPWVSWDEIAPSVQQKWLAVAHEAQFIRGITIQAPAGATIILHNQQEIKSMMPTDKGVADLKATSASGDNTDFTPAEVERITDRRYLSGRQIAEGQALLREIAGHFNPQSGYKFHENVLEEKIRKVLNLINSATS